MTDDLSDPPAPGTQAHGDDAFAGYRRLAACLVAAEVRSDLPRDAFFRSEMGALWCAWLDLDPETVLRWLARRQRLGARGRPPSG